jgi:hypothetical protein
VKHLSGAQLKDSLLALLNNIRLRWKGLPGTNALAYYKNLQITTVKSLIPLAPGVTSTKIFKKFFQSLLIDSYLKNDNSFLED